MVVRKALALLRIGLSLAVLWTLLGWWADFEFFFTRLGPLPLSALAVDTPPGTVAWSLYNISTASSWPYLLFALTTTAAVLLLVGWRSERVGPLLFVLVWSLQSRTAVACDLRDEALWLGLLIGCLTPWAAAWAWRPSPAPQGRARAMLLLLVLLAVVPALFKPTSSWAGFLALGPRAHPVPGGVTYRTVVEDAQRGERSFEAEAILKGSERRRLYQGRWEDPAYRGLAIWWVYWTFGRERAGASGANVVGVRLYRSEEGGQRRLVASWPIGLAATSSR